MTKRIECWIHFFKVFELLETSAARKISVRTFDFQRMEKGIVGIQMSIEQGWRSAPGRKRDDQGREER